MLERGIEKVLVDGLIAHHLHDQPPPSPWLNWRRVDDPRPGDPVVKGHSLRPGGSPNQRALAYARALLSEYDLARPAVLAWYRWQLAEAGLDLEEGTSGYGPHYHQGAAASVALSALVRGDEELAYAAGSAAALRVALYCRFADSLGHVRIPGPRWRWPGTHEAADVLVQDALGLPPTIPADKPWWHDAERQRRSIGVLLTRRLKWAAGGLWQAWQEDLVHRLALRYPIHRADLGGGQWVAWTPYLEGWDNLQPLTWALDGELGGWLGLQEGEQVWEARSAMGLQRGELVWGARSVMVRSDRLGGWIRGGWGPAYDTRVEGVRTLSPALANILEGASEAVIYGAGRMSFEPPAPPPPSPTPPTEPNWTRARHAGLLALMAIKDQSLERALAHIDRQRRMLEGKL